MEASLSEYEVQEYRQILEAGLRQLRQFNKRSWAHLQRVRDLEQQLLAEAASQTVSSFAFSIRMTEIQRLQDDVRQSLWQIHEQRRNMLRALYLLDHA